ncbi:MAG TPA: hypothetical protein DCS24_03035, partial [Erythrobacter sp.]|nr:hypothetical protein [Erythrobacter sp.]
METYSQRLTAELAKANQLSVIALRGKEDGQPPSTLRLLLFPFRVLLDLFRQTPEPQIVHLGDMAIWPLGLFTRLCAPRATIVISAHGTDVSYSRRGGLKGRLYGLYQRFGSSVFQSASIIANSKATAAACRHLGWRNVEVVPLATDLHPPRSRNLDHQSILFAGRIIRQKGLSWFVNEVLDQLPLQFHLQVAGSVWDKTEASALDHPRVEFLGTKSQHDLAELYANALCIVLPNLELPNGEFEGFGLVACEGASAGGVVLAAKTGGLTDAVVDGRTG